MAVPLDEFPVHQVPLSMAHVASSDRNAYDRSYFNAHDRTGDVFFITGMGVYPNLGVTDCFATLRRGNEQVTLRASDALGDDRMRQEVGPFRIEVIEPLHAYASSAMEDRMALSATSSGRVPSPSSMSHRTSSGSQGG